MSQSRIQQNNGSSAVPTTEQGAETTQANKDAKKNGGKQYGVTSDVVNGNVVKQTTHSPLQEEFNLLRSELFGGDKSKQKDMDNFLRAHNEFLVQVNAGNAWTPEKNSGAVNEKSAAPTGDPSLADAKAVDTSALKKAPGAPITTKDVKSYLQTVLAERSGKFSNRNLGGPTNLAYWTDDKVKQLQQGIEAARQFYPNFPPQTLAKLIIAEGAQESTGNPNAGIDAGQHDWSKSMDGAGLGFLQVTPRFAVQDFIHHGTPIKDASGKVLVDPKGAIDLSNPAVNVAMWAWYTRNSVAAGESLNEVALGNKGSPVTRDFGNAQWSWLGGPHNDRHDKTTAGGYEDYHARIKDYFVQSNFGTAEEFEKLLDTPVAGTLANTRFNT